MFTACRLALAAKHFTVPPIPSHRDSTGGKEMPFGGNVEVLLMVQKVAEVLVILLLAGSLHVMVLEVQ